VRWVRHGRQMQDAQPSSAEDAPAAQQDVAVAQQDARPSASRTPQGIPQLHGTTRCAVNPHVWREAVGRVQQRPRRPQPVGLGHGRGTAGTPAPPPFLDVVDVRIPEPGSGDGGVN
jgi:hypothetical protein